MNDLLSKLVDIAENIVGGPPSFYHGSFDALPIGTILTPRDGYKEEWGHTDFYRVLEKHRPPEMLSHHQSVFMVRTIEDIDLAGGIVDRYILTVEPLSNVQRHDQNWSTMVSLLVADGATDDDDKVKESARNYWHGIPYKTESVWEYLTSSARVIAVEEY